MEYRAISLFQEHFQSNPHVVASAPGRVNVIGEHTDYNEGFVFPAAIDRFAAVAASPRTDHMLVIRSENARAGVKAPLHDLLPMRSSSWANYVKGVAAMLLRSGCQLRGANITVHGNVPRGAGLSSSAALEMATAFAIRALNGLSVTDDQLITLCQKAEQTFVGVQCGIMDQFASCKGKRGHALFLDCQSLAYDLVPLPPGVCLVVLDTGVRRTLSGSSYNHRREECTTAVTELSARIPGLRSLRDVTPEAWEAFHEALSPVSEKRGRHVINENARVLEAVRALRDADFGRLGKLMYDSHFSLQHDYEVSCPELDALVDICAETEGVIGARMTGAGFGGCVLSLTRTEALDDLSRRIMAEYPQKTGKSPAIHLCVAEDGASVRIP
jgi:galactokinase